MNSSVAVLSEKDLAYFPSHKDAESSLLSESDSLETISINPAFSQPPWAYKVLSKTNDLMNLKLAWDSYSAIAIQKRSIEQMLDILFSSASPTTPAPSLVPLPDGGIQVEWHNGSQDLELSFQSDGNLSAYYFSSDKEIEQSNPSRELIKELIQQIH